MLKAYDMYYDGKDIVSNYDVFIETWKDGVIIKSEYIDSKGKLVVKYDKHNV